jgi:hypothetical protein
MSDSRRDEGLSEDHAFELPTGIERKSAAAVRLHGLVMPSPAELGIAFDARSGGSVRELRIGHETCSCLHAGPTELGIRLNGGFCLDGGHLRVTHQAGNRARCVFLRACAPHHQSTDHCDG